MKVTKAKGLNTDLTDLHGKNPRAAVVRLRRLLAADAMYPRESVLRVEPAVFVVCCHVDEPNRISPFALATFIWGRK
jgi:hypothetical protein